MTPSRNYEDDMQPASEEQAGEQLAEFACWRAIRPAWLRVDGADPRGLLPDQRTTEYFGGILVKKFDKALHQAFMDKLDPEATDDPQILIRRSRVREALARLPRPESWLEAWPSFWDFFTRPRPKGPPRLDSLFKAWPQMDEAAVDEVMTTWEQTGRKESQWAFVQLRALHVNVPRAVSSMRARLNLPFKELAADWCAQLGMKSQLEEGAQAHSMEEKRAGRRGGEDGLTYAETLPDSSQRDAGTGADMAAQMQQIRRIPEEFVADMTLKERAIVLLRIFGAPLYRPPVSDCKDIDPPRGRDALYQHTFQPVVTRIREKAAQICRAPAVQQRRQADADVEDKAMAELVATRLEEEIRTHLCAWAGHPAGGGKKLSEKAPAWLLELLDSAAPRWKTPMKPESIIKP